MSMRHSLCIFFVPAFFAVIPLQLHAQDEPIWDDPESQADYELDPYYGNTVDPSQFSQDGPRVSDSYSSTTDTLKSLYAFLFGTDGFDPYNPIEHAPLGHLLQHSGYPKGHWAAYSSTWPANHMSDVSLERHYQIIWPADPPGPIDDFWPPVDIGSPNLSWPRDIGSEPLEHSAELSSQWPANHHNYASAGWIPHDVTLSDHWGQHSNHFLEISQSWPDPNVHDQWVSRKWISNHDGVLSKKGGVTSHLVVFSLQNVQNHAVVESRTWWHDKDLSERFIWKGHRVEVSVFGVKEKPPSTTYYHDLNWSRSWPNNHDMTISLTWHGNHNKQHSHLWPAGHQEGFSRKWPHGLCNWPANHITEESEQYSDPYNDPSIWFPPNHYRMESAIQVSELIKNIVEMIPQRK